MIRHDEIFSVRTRQTDYGIAIVDIAGDINITSTPGLSEHIKSLIQSGQYCILLNLKDVKYVSSTGWGLFISFLKETRENHGDIRLSCLNGDVLEIFKMLDFPSLFSTFQSEQDAVYSFIEHKCCTK